MYSTGRNTMIKSNRKRSALGIGAAVAALVMLGGVPAGASAAEPERAMGIGEGAHQADAGILAVTTASGSRSCRPGEQVYVRITLVNSGKAAVAGNFIPRVAVGLDHFFELGVRSADWEASAPGGIQTINDGCTSM